MSSGLILVNYFTYKRAIFHVQLIHKRCNSCRSVVYFFLDELKLK